MCTEWMPALELPLSWEQFRQLPRNAAYKYEYFDGRAHLSPRPKTYHALLDLGAADGCADGQELKEIRLRPVRDADWGDLVPLFAATFARIQPFGSLDEATREEAAARA